MKNFVYLFILSLSALLSCNDVQKTQNEVTSKPSVTTAADASSVDWLLNNCPYENFIISNEEFNAMKGNFKQPPFNTLLNYSQIPENYWIDACYLKNLESAIIKHNSTATEKIDEFWVFMGADESRDERVQVFLVPASGKTPKWISIGDIGGCSPVFSNYDNNYTNVASPMLKRFNKKHRKEGSIFGKKVDNFSNGIRFKLCLLSAINKLIKDNQAKSLNGIRIYNAAYKENKAPGQKYDNQTSIVIVFTKMGPDGVIIDDFDVVRKFYDKAKDLKILNTFNRGELCPKNCP
jgi:hypothetical protein